MTKYWYEKRMWGLSPVFWPVTWHGWLFQPAVLWLFIIVPGFWLISYTPAAWQNGLGFAVLISAYPLAIAVLFLKTNPGPGWLAGWEKERRFVPRFRWFSSTLYLAGTAAGLWIFITQENPAFGVLFLYFYQLLMIALLYKVADPDKGGGESRSAASVSSIPSPVSKNSVAGLPPGKF
ncbi:hypothetical protein [Hyphomicrobium sp. 2TAF46]|uniref:hypothetical protein n=1 Tax=Hyphomicrobium sp. 2TAF46 TaxID=3233019 RepID=UPI003F903A36